jgi:hypothetical protein
MLAFLLLYSLWAALFGRQEFILYALRALPFSLLGIIVLDLIGLGPWIRRSRLRRAIPSIFLVVAIVIVVAYGELWAAVPFIVMLAWVVGYVLKQQFWRGGSRTTPPVS